VTRCTGNGPNNLGNQEGHLVKVIRNDTISQAIIVSLSVGATAVNVFPYLAS